MSTKLTFSVRRFGQLVQTVRHGHRARLQHLFVEVLLLQRGEVGFELVFVDGFGDGHRGDGVADLLGQFVLFAELFPVIVGISMGLLTREVAEKMTGRKTGRNETHIVVSTSSIVILPWICFMAAPAFFMATRVSWLMFADSME